MRKNSVLKFYLTHTCFVYYVTLYCSATWCYAPVMVACFKSSTIADFLIGDPALKGEVLRLSALITPEPFILSFSLCRAFFSTFIQDVCNEARCLCDNLPHSKRTSNRMLGHRGKMQLTLQRYVLPPNQGERKTGSDMFLKRWEKS